MIESNPSRTHAATPDQNERSAASSVQPRQNFLTAGGRYELREQIARGGMGAVFRGWDAVLQRDMAVKVAQDGRADSAHARRRFEHEAIITAQLQHPSIPPVYDRGTLPDGRPFLAMKLVKGRTLDDLIKQPDGPLNGLGVFEALCQAVGYAHSRGVLHRDLKPLNVMVGAFGEVQVMDWGLAKYRADAAAASEECETVSAFTDPRTADDSKTSAGSVLGTPAFMPPEQAFGAIDQVTERSDVFGLGAILCAILTGGPPFVGADAESTRQLAARGKTADALARLDGCGADPAVVALAKRCLSVEPTDRPANGSEVAAEVARLRAAADRRAKRAEVARAAADTRRRVLTWAAAAVVAVLATGTAVSLVQADRARAAEKKAGEQLLLTQAEQRRAVAAEKETAEQLVQTRAEERRARDAQAESAAMVRFTEEKVFAAARPKGQAGGLGSDVSLRAALIGCLPALDAGFADQPLVEARLRKSVGTTFIHLGEAPLAVIQYARSRQLYEGQLGPDHPDTLRLCHNLATAYADTGRYADSLRLQEQTLAAQRRVLPPDHQDTLRSMLNLAATYADSGRHADALDLRERTLAAQHRVLPPDHQDTIMTMFGLASSFATVGRHADSLELCGRAVAAQRRTLPGDHPDLLRGLHHLAGAFERTGDLAQAIKLYTEAWDGCRRTLPPDHLDTLRSMTGVANCCAGLRRHPEAIRHYEGVIAALKRAHPTNATTVFGAMNNLAGVYEDVGRLADCLALREEVLAGRRRLLRAGHPDTLRGMHNLAIAYEKCERHADALRLRQEELATRQRVQPPDHADTLRCMCGVASSLLALDRGPEAVALIDACAARAEGTAVDPDVIPWAMALRLDHFCKLRDALGCRATAEAWEKLNRADAEGLYNAACFRARTAAVQAESAGVGAARIAAADADKAMAWLFKAVTAGYKDTANLRADPDLDAVRRRADFRKLCEGLNAKFPPPNELAPPPRAKSL